MIGKVAQKAEKHGFNDILIPIDSRCMDPVVSAAYILENTEQINTLIAYRPGITSPQVLASMLSTLDNERRRVRLNMVQGNIHEALRQGYDVGDSMELPLRMRSFSKSLRELMYADGEQHKYADNYYTYEGATVNPKLKTSPPAMFIGGGKYAMELAAELYDYYMTFGDSVEKIGEYVKAAKNYAQSNFNRDIKIGIGINIVVRDTTEEAWNDCKKLISHATEESIQEAKSFYAKNKAIGGRSYEELVENNFILEPNLWAGLAQVRSGPVATIYGSYEEVTNKIMDYLDIGVEYFSLTGYPFIGEVENVGKVIQMVKSRLTVSC